MKNLYSSPVCSRQPISQNEGFWVSKDRQGWLTNGLQHNEPSKILSFEEGDERMATFYFWKPPHLACPVVLSPPPLYDFLRMTSVGLLTAKSNVHREKKLILSVEMCLDRHHAVCGGLSGLCVCVYTVTCRQGRCWILRLLYLSTHKEFKNKNQAGMTKQWTDKSWTENRT